MIRERRNRNLESLKYSAKELLSWKERERRYLSQKIEFGVYIYIVTERKRDCSFSPPTLTKVEESIRNKSKFSFIL